MGVFGGRLEVIITEQHADVTGFAGKRQFQPILHQMFLVGAGAADHALGRLALLNGAAVGGDPVVVLVAPVQILNEKPGDLAVIDVTKPRAGQPYAAASLFGADVHQADAGENTGNMGWVDVAAARHRPATGLFSPVIEQLSLFRHNELCPEYRACRFHFRRP